MNEHIETPVATSKPKKKGSKGTLLLMLLVLILVVGLSATGVLYYQARQQLKQLTQPGAQEELAQREIQAVVQKLGKLTLLPEEDPVVATIIDAAFLSTQSAFYKQAENGDKLVIYPEAQKAFVFSPTRNIIVNSGPLVLDQQGNAQPDATQETTEAETEPTPRVNPSPVSDTEEAAQ